MNKEVAKIIGEKEERRKSLNKLTDTFATRDH
jgi:hypothetical protein